MKFFLISLIIPLYIFTGAIHNSSTGYIMIQYLGDPGKPYPIIIFDCFGKFDTTFEGFYVYKINVTEKELQSVKETIEQNETVLGSDTLQDPIGIRIVINEKEKLVLLKHKPLINLLFKQLIKLFDNTPKRGLVEYPLNVLLRRLEIETP